MHQDTHPSHQPLNLFFDKVKDQTLLEDFKHSVISRTKHKRVDRVQYVEQTKNEE